MAVKVEIVPARAAHVRSIARRMRQADRDEVWAGSRLKPAQALIKSLRHSSSAWTALIDGRPEVMWGVGDLNVLAQVGMPWLLGTDAVDTHNRRFLRVSIEWRNQLLGRYQVLKNFVDLRNTVSIRWLEWLGFKLGDEVISNGQAFRLFEMRSSDV